MLSILIPTYNNVCYDLVEELQRQSTAVGVKYEIIVMDDCSEQWCSRNDGIEDLPCCRLIRLSKNVGRSIIRNRLAKEAKGEWLLFVDSDSKPESEKFVERYVEMMKECVTVVCGGRSYQKEKPEEGKLLHWLYGSQREVRTLTQRKDEPYRNFLVSNMMIRREVFDTIRFDETICGYGHEDAKFGMELRKRGILVHHIDNDLRHVGLVETQKFLSNTFESLNEVVKLMRAKEEGVEQIKLARIYNRLKRMHCDKVMGLFQSPIAIVAKRQLATAHPSLKLLDVWKLSKLCSMM